ncbi:MAG: phage replisome organizer N-terminal domain-containing protein [Lachnospiraceae bacterium]|nr:phage replisome organizer N-terminal domain-containing protein [Lachnospiraceae bacterium]
MSDCKKYYYLKLKEDFYESEDMKLLQAQPDGYLYSDILLKLYLKSLKQGGRLMYRDIIPYTPDMIATITGHSVGVVEKAMRIFEQMELVEILDNGAIYLMDIQNFIGQSSSEADRIRKYRSNIKAEKTRLLEKDTVTNVTTNDMTNVTTGSVQMYDKGTPEIRDKSIENKLNNKSINTLIAQSSGEQTSEQEEGQTQSMLDGKKEMDSQTQGTLDCKRKSASTKEKEPEADVAAIPLIDGTEWRPSESLFAEYVRLSPNVDVKQQFNEMRRWCLSNPTKKKTQRGVKRFVNSWLAKEQDRGGQKRYSGGGYQQASQSYSPDVFDRLANESRGDLNG